jgi:hypothetical protein
MLIQVFYWVLNIEMHSIRVLFNIEYGISNSCNTNTCETKNYDFIQLMRLEKDEM